MDTNNENKIFITDENGVEYERTILVVLNIEALGKDYVVYYDDKADEVNYEVMIVNQDGTLEAIESDEEFQMVSEAFEGYLDATEE